MQIQESTIQKGAQYTTQGQGGGGGGEETMLGWGVEN